MATETPASPALLERGGSPESPTPFQALLETQDRRGSKEYQGTEVQLEAPDTGVSLASPPNPTSLGHLVTSGPLASSAWKVIGVPRAHLDLLHFLEAKEMRGPPGTQEPQDPKVGVETLAPRAGPACLVSLERKAPVASRALWGTQELWEGPETEVLQVPKVTAEGLGLQGPWVPPGLWGFPRRSSLSQDPWVLRVGEDRQEHRVI